MRESIDITPVIYVTIMVIVFLLSLGCSKTNIIPAAKYQPKTWNGLTVSDYESHDGTNYLEDAMEVFPKEVSYQPKQR